MISKYVVLADDGKKVLNVIVCDPVIARTLKNMRIRCVPDQCSVEPGWVLQDDQESIFGPPPPEDDVRA